MRTKKAAAFRQRVRSGVAGINQHSQRAAAAFGADLTEPGTPLGAGLVSRRHATRFRLHDRAKGIVLKAAEKGLCKASDRHWRCAAAFSFRRSWRCNRGRNRTLRPARADRSGLLCLGRSLRRSLGRFPLLRLSLPRTNPRPCSFSQCSTPWTIPFLASRRIASRRTIWITFTPALRSQQPTYVTYAK